MPRWLLWTPVLALIAATAVFGLRAGQKASDVSESDAISIAAQRYLAADASRSPQDCHAVPAFGVHTWIVVTCRPQQGQPQRYEVSRLGHLRLITTSPARPET